MRGIMQIVLAKSYVSNVVGLDEELTHSINPYFFFIQIQICL